jgi:hypothetical protein
VYKTIGKKLVDLHIWVFRNHFRLQLNIAKLWNIDSSPFAQKHQQT